MESYRDGIPTSKTDLVSACISSHLDPSTSIAFVPIIESGGMHAGRARGLHVAPPPKGSGHKGGAQHVPGVFTLYSPEHFSSAPMDNDPIKCLSTSNESNLLSHLYQKSLHMM